MSAGLQACHWPLSRLGPALFEAASQLHGAAVTRSLDISVFTAAPKDLHFEPLELSQVMQEYARALPSDLVASSESIAHLLDRNTPFLVASTRLQTFVFILGSEKKRARLLGSDGTVVTASRDEIRHILGLLADPPPWEHPILVSEDVGLPKERREQLNANILASHELSLTPACAWLVEACADRGLRQRMRAGKAGRKLAYWLALHSVALLILGLSWSMIARAALGGVPDRGWLIAWGLCLLTAVFFRVMGRAYEATLLRWWRSQVRELLFASTQNLARETVRKRGAAAWLGIVTEATRGESMLATFVPGTITAASELVAAAVLAQFSGAAILFSVTMLGVFVAAAVSLSNYYREYSEYLSNRLHLFQDTIDGVRGHRTKVLQEHPRDWNQRADLQLASLIAKDFSASHMLARAELIPHVWFVVGLLAPLQLFVAGKSQSVGFLIALGVYFLAYHAIANATQRAVTVVQALAMTRNAISIIQSAGPPPSAGKIAPWHLLAGSRKDLTLMEVRSLGFSHPAQARTILHDVDLSIANDAQILLTGRSGSGKSTLASLLSGVRLPTHGMILLHGLDRATVGPARWAQCAVAVPQFHENHIFSATLLFNLLLGRQWPASYEDKLLAIEICLELGLGPLLDRMPAHLAQLVGTPGWVLSHGERSRIFIGRALLQNPSLLLLDESFAALDPETLEIAMACVKKRARAVMIIAHP